MLALANRRSAWRHLALSGVAAVLLAGCGNDDPSEPAAQAPAAAPAPPAVPAPAPTTLKSATDVGPPLTPNQLDSVVAISTAAGLAGASRCAVQVVEIVYATSAPDGTPAQASGAVMIPSEPGCEGPYPLVAYSPGTDLQRTRSMANIGDPEVQLVAAMLASQGFVVAATDYLGYAKSDLAYHPYLHAASEATAALDALRAARELGILRGVGLNGKVLVTGYSQGGHASMATQKAIETGTVSGFTLAGAGHMSGPYNLSGSVSAALGDLPLGNLGSTFYISFTVTALQKVYKDLYTAPGDFFQAPYDATIEGIFPSPPGVSVDDLIAQGKLPVLLSNLVTEGFIAAAMNPASALHRAFVANSPTDFAPKARTLLCGGSKDPVVRYQNTRDAVAAFQAAGSTAVTSFDVENEPSYANLLRDNLAPVGVNGGYHASRVPPLCLLQVRNLFLTLR